MLSQVDTHVIAGGPLRLNLAIGPDSVTVLNWRLPAGVGQCSTLSLTVTRAETVHRSITNQVSRQYRLGLGS
jgi:hypothetical protein